MRGGTSKGPFFLASDLPADPALRDRVLLALMGSPDARQIDGIGGADTLTSKVAIVSPSTRPDADVDYLFLQVVPDEPRVDASQNCGNMLAGIGPFAIEKGLVAADDGETKVRIHMVNTASVAIATVQTPRRRVRYDGDARIDGVPGTAAPIVIDFLDIAGSSTGGALLPTGNARDVVEGIEATLIDNGMPVVVMRASDFGKTGHETPAELEADADLKARVERVRLAAGRLMNLGDVTKKTVPKMCLVAPAVNGGAVSTRNFIPHKVHKAIGVFGAVSVATACAYPGTVAAEVASAGAPAREVANGGTRASEAAAAGAQLGVRRLDIEHPTGFFTVDMLLVTDGDTVHVERSALLRTARALMAGDVYVPTAVWDGTTRELAAAGKTA
jgi:4-oxalomesaconate tautomerase